MSMFVIIAIGGIAIIVYFFVLRIKKMKEIEEKIVALASGTLEMSPTNFLEIRNISFGGSGSPKYANNYNFSGIYILFNHSKNMFYIGQGQNVLDRINSQFTGKGNKHVFNDYKKGDRFSIKAMSLKHSKFSTIEDLKTYTINSYNSHSSDYRKTRKKIQQPLVQDTATPTIKRSDSVTSRIKSIKQPYGGYLPAKSFDVEAFHDNNVLGDENIHGSLIGLTIDYLTRYLTGTSPRKAFEISYLGAQIVREEALAKQLLSNINGLSDKSVISACKLSGFDVGLRAGPAFYTKPVSEINPDETTIENIKVMVERSLLFFKKHGPVIKDGFTFEGGYTETISTGDGDFLTKDTLWDFKVLRRPLTSKHTLQLLIYYIMGCHSIHNEFKEIKYLGVFNPRINKVYRFKLSDLDKDIIDTIENDIICY